MAGEPTQEDFDLERFVAAQSGIFEQALGELQAGEKRTHWMWFIFPQVAGLGSSPMAMRYAIGSRAEAAAYLAHPVLGRRLLLCMAAVNGLEGRSVERIFGYPDDLKFRSSATLFAAVAGEESPFTQALAKYFGGKGDPATEARL